MSLLQYLNVKLQNPVKVVMNLNSLIFGFKLGTVQPFGTVKCTTPSTSAYNSVVAYASLFILVSTHLALVKRQKATSM